MMMGVNYALVLGAALVRFIVGWVWYTSLFGKDWKEEVKKNRRESSKFTPQVAMFSSFIFSCVMAFVIYSFAEAARSVTFQQGLFLGFFAWLGFVIPTKVSSVLYEGDSWKMFCIHAAYDLVTLMLMGGIIGEWGGF
jgi:hypothetical protein